ncbi:hypothetical protein [Furfurilactobacillus curtus]|uniref:Uncharacterized protein n=1 Tax=Furfurilactobacillus curtus TaxID=1746200 RepID=A0ABQ5JLU6_9LACO
MDFSPYLAFHSQSNAKNTDLVIHSALPVNEHFKISALDVIPGAPEVQPGQTNCLNEP